MSKIKSALGAVITSAALLSSGVTQADVTTISYSIWDQDQYPVVKQLLETFETRNPDIKVDLQLTPWSEYWIKMYAAATGGVISDVFWMNMLNAEQYAKNGIIEPLDQYIAQDQVTFEHFSKDFVDAYKYDGQQFAIPRDMDSTAVWYNKKIFDEAGVDYPTNEWTWDDMVDIATELRDNTNDDIYPLMMQLEEQQTTYFNFFLQSGVSILSEDSKSSGLDHPEVINALRRVQELMEQDILPDGRRISGLRGQDLFQSNRVGMFYTGSWLANPFSQNEAINQHVGVVEMPAIKQKGGISHAVSYVMSSNSPHKEESWRLIQFLMSPEAQETLAANKAVIPAYLPAGQIWQEAFDTVDVSAHISSLEFVTPYPAAGNTAKWDGQLGDGLKRIWLGQKPESVMPGLIRRMNRTLQEG